MNVHVASAVFNSLAAAGRALSDLHTLGVLNSAVSVLTPEDTGENVSEETGTSSLRHLLGSSAVGAGLGIAALAIPGVGPLAAAGAIAAAALPGSAAVGATVGGLASLLSPFGIDEKKALRYGESLCLGSVLLLVDVQETELGVSEIQEILDKHGGFSATIAAAQS